LVASRPKQIALHINLNMKTYRKTSICKLIIQKERNKKKTEKKPKDEAPKY